MTSLRPPAAAGVPAAPSPPSPSPPLALTIRFSASLPDLDLEIPHPAQTTVVSLKHLIRARLSEPTSQRRLRFIQGGRILPDGAALAAVLRAPPAPPPTTTTATTTTINYPDHQGKGKGVLNKPPPPQRIYVNCSIGDSLTTAELEDEARAAAAPAPNPSSSPLLSPAARGSNASSPGPGTPGAGGGAGGGNTTTAAPRGFERLLNAGFTPAEVNQLRLQFRSIHSSRFTPDTLPSPDSFRRMEDSWIDDNGAAVPATALAGSSAPDGADDGSSGLAGHLDALVWGVLTGFMWPLGSFGWLVRQPGIHSDRWRIMVCFGVLFSFLFGIVRGISGAK